MRTSALWFALLLVFAAVAPATALAADGRSAPGAELSTAPADTATAAVETGSPDRIAALRAPEVHRQVDDETPPRTTVEISLQSDRSAEWRVETHYALDTENETRAFRTLASRYESGDADVGPNAVLFEALQRRASESTGRSMRIENVTYHSSIDESAERGTLAVTFRWTNFLREGENETLVLDDVFTLPTAETDERRTWLSIFDADQEILIRPPDGYTVTGTSIAVQQRESAIVLAEPSDFEGEEAELRVTYSPVGPADRLPIGVLAGAGIVALVVLAAVWMLRTRSGGAGAPWGSSPPDDGAPPTAEADADGGSDAPYAGTAAEADGRNGTGEAGGPPSGAERPASADADAPAGADIPDDAVNETEADLSLLSDEERVERLLERNGGRMKQATIVDETDWSDAKVSQLLSAMAEEGRVDKLRLGRENLISLPDDAESRDAEHRDARDGDGGSAGDA
ncbi:helix-turn-helix transcriptional regulator [Halobellus limi]|uniref:Transmembrane glycoprotein / HTH domain protein n=1 Tax=Halobellus limi TaxID=699433 RepID=A0A1H5VM14_9EURY|nr:hypothetical protein [Halobellus limi]QCC46677.1 hypothetical protein DV707_02765 [Halobellus limi]SEF88284.1 hypothetical protein SAMN04488133_1003 [Halobellus limi]